MMSEDTEIPGTGNWLKIKKRFQEENHRSLDISEMHGSDDENLKATGVKTNAGG